MHIIVVGSGVAGLGTALAAAAAGHRVSILERDATPMPASADDAFEWDRRGAPQVRHSHAFLARLRNLLVDRAPVVYAALLGAGATELRFVENLPPTLTDFEPREGDDRLCAIACRRTTFEWVLRDSVLGVAGVELLDGIAVDGLIAERECADHAPAVVGVHGRRVDGSDFEMVGDVVVDATGPRTASPQWLVDIGVGEPPEHLVPSEIIYLSRFYRLRDGFDAPETSGPIGGDLGYAKYAVFVGDNRTFSITFAIDTDDKDLRILTDVAAFEAGAAQLPAAQPWLDGRSEPITAVHPMAGLRNRRRFFVDESGTPIVRGFAAVGDAHVCTNPLYGRGCSLGMVHAFGLVDALAGPDWERAFHDFTERELDPWFRAAVQQDREAKALLDRSATAEFDDPRSFVREVFREGLLPAVRTSPVVYRAFLRWFNLETTPDALMNDAEVLAAVMQCYAERGSRPPEPPLGPDRATFLSAI
jgi:2-polyprenyl-6-methoxyphenol hydroxylase-like FAD-dependent oxidoreductase